MVYTAMTLKVSEQRGRRSEGFWATGAQVLGQCVLRQCAVLDAGDRGKQVAQT